MCEIERGKRERERQEFYRVHTFSKLILDSWLRCFVSLHGSDHAEAIRICDASHWDTRKSVLPRNSTDIRVRWIPTMISNHFGLCFRCENVYYVLIFRSTFNWFCFLCSNAWPIDVIHRRRPSTKLTPISTHRRAWTSNPHRHWAINRERIAVYCDLPHRQSNGWPAHP